MGADVFFTEVRGGSAREAFVEAVRQASYEYGVSGYTGTIAEKNGVGFVRIAVPDGEDPYVFAGQLIDEQDERVDDKWGPAGCIRVDDGSNDKRGRPLFLFFGWASS